MKSMKKHILFVLTLVAAMSLNAQEQHYTQKLDSVVGSNDFDWTRWKKVFTYYVDDAVIQDDTYSWEEGLWKLSGGVVYQYASPDFQQLQGVISLGVDEAGDLTQASWTAYEYDTLNHLTLVMNYTAGDTAWIENSKYEYSYNEDGLIDTCLYSTIRNGNWRESQRTLYSYDENLQCTGLRVQGKGGWGPNANQWRDSYRYEFEYQDGQLLTELYYTPVGWFGSEMALDSKWEYEFDANGNLLGKTGSVTNDSKDWVVRDVFVNRYEPTVDASTVLGLKPFWNVMGTNGMNFATGAMAPLNNQWLSCSITSASLDTEFTLYCSGFEGVEETPITSLKAWSDGRRLVVENDQPADISVFDVLGRVVASENQTTRCEFNLTPGLYIVGDSKSRVKVIVNE